MKCTILEEENAVNSWSEKSTLINRVSWVIALSAIMSLVGLICTYIPSNNTYIPSNPPSTSDSPVVWYPTNHPEKIMGLTNHPETIDPGKLWIMEHEFTGRTMP